MADLTPAAPTFERKIGNTTYIVTARYTSTATEKCRRENAPFDSQRIRKSFEKGK